MNKLKVYLLAAGISLMGCAHKANADVVAELPPPEYEAFLDSLRDYCNRNPLLYTQYFLYDITGDSIPELWVSIGTCEADTKLQAFGLENGKPKMIYEGEGGHSDYFIFEDQLIGVMCHMGYGVVITYTYDGQKVADSMVEFSTMNEDGKALSYPTDSVADKKLQYWEEYNYIKLQPL